MTRDFEIPLSVAKKASDTFLRRFRRCVESFDPRVSLEDYRVDLWIEALGEDYEDLAEEIYVKWRKLRYRNLALPETTTNLLKSLHKQYQLAIVTNGPSQSQWEKIKELKLEDHFDAIVVSGDLKYEKPQPEIFHRVCTMLGVQPFECLIVGDKIETDILGGINTELGITVWMPIEEYDPRGEETQPTSKPDFIIRDLHQLVGILQGGNDKSKSKGLQRTKGKSGSSSSSATGTSAASSTSTPGPSSSSKAVDKTELTASKAVVVAVASSSSNNTTSSTIVTPVVVPEEN